MKSKTVMVSINPKILDMLRKDEMLGKSDSERIRKVVELYIWRKTMEAEK